MAYQETHTTSYGSRLSNSFKKIGTGLAMFIGATVLLFWNEGRAVKTAETIKEAQGTAVHVDNVSEVKADLNGQLIHATAMAESHDTLRDEMFGAAVPAIKLIRNVEYYQWQEYSKEEKHEKFGGSEETVTTYTYKKKWTNAPINSAEFHDPAYQNSNFVITELENEKQLAEDVTFGAYNLPDFLKNSISGEKDITLSMDSVQKATLNHDIIESLRASGRVDVRQLADSTGKEIPYLAVNGNTAYIGKSSGNPQIGDVRVTFKAVPSAQVSLIAKVSGDTFEPYMSANGNNFSRVEMGTVSMGNMFQGAHNDNTTLTWILRLVGILMAIGGLKMTFEILSMLFKWFPALGSIVNMGVGLVCSVIGFVWSLLIISIAWLFYRPIIGISLIVVATAAIWLLWKKSKQNEIKGFNLLLAAFCMSGIMSCGVASCSDDPETPTWKGIKSPDDAKVTGTVSGDFDIDNPQPGSMATVTLSAFPGSQNSFRDLQSQIGGSPVGAAVLPLVGMEVYYQRGSKIGLECIRSSCTESTFTDRLQQRLLDMYKSTDANYFRPYQVAAFLKGATPENGYNPTRPYTFELTYKSKEEAQLLGGTVYTFRLKYSGSESSKDVLIQVVRPNGQPYFIASSWSSCYVYVKQIAYGQTFNGLD